MSSFELKINASQENYPHISEIIGILRSFGEVTSAQDNESNTVKITVKDVVEKQIEELRGRVSIAVLSFKEFTGNIMISFRMLEKQRENN